MPQSIHRTVFIYTWLAKNWVGVTKLWDLCRSCSGGRSSRNGCIPSSGVDSLSITVVRQVTAESGARDVTDTGACISADGVVLQWWGALCRQRGQTSAAVPATSATVEYNSWPSHQHFFSAKTVRLFVAVVFEFLTVAIYIVMLLSSFVIVIVVCIHKAQHLNYDAYLVIKTEDQQNCSVLCWVQQLCIVICTHVCTVLTANCVV